MPKIAELPQGSWQFQGVSDDQLQPPKFWGEDQVTRFLAVAHKNSYLTINEHRSAIKQLNTCLTVYEAAADSYITHRTACDADEEDYTGFDVLFAFFMGAQKSLYASLCLIFSHQQAEATKTLRGAIETTLYAYHVARSPRALEIWLERPTAQHLRNDASAASARKARSAAGAEFSVPKILRELAVENSRLASKFGEKYEELIDAGGHYNLPALREQMSIRPSKKLTGRRLDFRLIGATESERNFALKELMTISGLVLRAFDLLFSQKWGPDISERISTFNRALR